MKISKEWNLNDLYNDINDPQIEKDHKKLTMIVDQFVTDWKDNPKLLTDISNLKKALDQYEELHRKAPIHKEMLYFGLLEEKYLEDEEIKGKIAKSSEFAVDISNKLEFFQLQLGKVEKANQERFLNSNEISEYKHFLEKIFETAKYDLSEEEEKIINTISKPATDNWSQMVASFIASETANVLTEEGKTVNKSFSELFSLTRSRNQDVRDSSGEAINKVNEKYSKVATHEINSLLEYYRQIEKLRGLERPDHARHLSDDIDTDVVDAMITEVSNNFEIPNKFYSFAAKSIGKEKLKYYERGVELSEAEMEFSYEEGLELVINVFSNLDSKFGEIVNKLNDEGRIDVYPQKGKAGGAFCAGRTITTPTFVLLNYNNKLEDVLTLAHELGHAVNNEMMRVQNELNYGAPTSVAEVSSTFFEDFVLEEIIKTADPETAQAIKIKRAMDDVSTIFRQVAAYKFEQDLHSKAREVGFVSTNDIGELFVKNMKGYLGNSVEMESGAENGWVYWDHFRRPFYVYSYASGLLISKALQNMVKEDKNNIDMVKGFLSAGMSASPKDIFGEIGIDITDKSFWDKGLQSIREIVESL